MNHADTVALGAVEKYFLGELSVAERDEFEVHFFECAECASQLQVLEAVRATVRQPLSVQPIVIRPWIDRPAVARWALAASVLLGSVVTYQNAFTFPQLRQAADRPRWIATVQPDVRFRGSPSAAAEFRIPLEFPQGFASYRVELQTASGARISELRISASQASTGDVGFPRTERQSGDLQVVIYGENASLSPQEVKRHRIYVP